jgi:glycine reductase
MRLEHHILNIRDVQFAESTEINDKVLYINRRDLQELIQQDKRFSRVDIELAHPDESCRILQVSDVIEPRAKINCSGEDFPGVLSKQAIAGSGMTCVLRGVAVVINDQSGTASGASGQLGNLIDMSGPGAELSTYAKTHNVVILPHSAEGIDTDDYRIALKLAAVKTAVYLAQFGKDLKSDEVEIYDLPSLARTADNTEDLIKVAYIFQVHSTNFPSIPGEPIFYGDNLRHLMPTIVHPNEVLDGAILNPHHGMGIETYTIQNHPLIKELYHRHGKDLYFVGVVITISPYTEPERERTATIAAKLVNSILGADGAILTQTVPGAPQVDVAQTAQRCEQLGVKTVLIMWDISPDGSCESGVVFNIPEASAIINTGNPLVRISLPPVERIIGRMATSPEGAPANGELTRILLSISGAGCQLGNSQLISVRY